jgi:hypothetical protein
MIAVTINPPPPHPLTARPKRNTARLCAAAVINNPMARTAQEKRIYTRGVKI